MHKYINNYKSATSPCKTVQSGAMPAIEVSSTKDAE